MPTSVSGAVCGVMVYSSLAFSVNNQVSLEWTTPHGTAPDGILLCATAAKHVFDPSTFVVEALEEGGSQFAGGTAQTVDLAGGYQRGVLLLRAFRGAAAWNHRPVEVGVAADVLGLDPHYAARFARRRYDLLTVDGAGASLAGVVQDPVWRTNAAVRAAASDAVVARLSPANTVAATALTDTERAAFMQELAELGRPAGNCALLTGTWKADTRYTLTFSAPNPANPAAGAGAAATGSATKVNLGWWMAPLSYAVPAAAASSAATSDGGVRGAGGMKLSGNRVTYTVRGDKRGAVCTPRATVSTTLHDACEVLAAAGMGATVAVAAGDNATACAAAVVYAAQPEATAGLGVAVSNATGCVGASAGGAGFVRSSRFGGHCVDCTNGTAGVDGCACDAARTTLKAGAVACGAPRGVAGTSTTTAALAAELCAAFSAVKAGLDTGGAVGTAPGAAVAGAHAVAAAHLAAFMAAAGPLADAADLAAANATYHASLMFDSRAPDDPTRRRGLAPNCAAPTCEGGRFTDATGNGGIGVLRDVRHDAAHGLRLIGYLLHVKGATCTALYDPGDVHADVYGAYDPSPLCSAAVPV